MKRMMVLGSVIFILSITGTVFPKESVQPSQSSFFNQTLMFANPFNVPPCNQTNYYTALRTTDYDGDCRTEVSIWQRSTGDFWYFGSSQNNTVPLHWGQSGDIPLDGDYDGDGKTDWAVFRKSTGYWYIKQSSNNAEVGKLFGNGVSDFPVPADYDGDGKTDLGILRVIDDLNDKYRPMFYYRKSSNNAIVELIFADGENNNFSPAIADYDGDGKDDVVIWYSATGEWKKASLGTNNSTVLSSYGIWGATGDVPVPGDYNGDGEVDFAYWRPSTGNWHIKGISGAVQFGQSTDKVVPGDYDGDNIMDRAVWRPSTGDWFVLKSTTGFWTIPFGTGTDIPIPGQRFQAYTDWDKPDRDACIAGGCTTRCPVNCP